MSLTPKQRAFIAEYLVDLNGAAAAVRAGYSPRTAAVAASKLLSNPEVSAEIAKAKADRSGRVAITADETLRQIGEIASSDLRLLFADNGSILPPRLWPDCIARAVASVEVVTRKGQDGEVDLVTKIKLWDKPKALEMVGRHLAMFTDRVEANSTVVHRVSDKPLTDDEWQMTYGEGGMEASGGPTESLG